jgi:hypothetical protein
MIIEKAQPWLLSLREVAAMRTSAKNWKVKCEVGQWSVVCRHCGDLIEVGEMRLNLKYFNFAAKRYTRIG